MAGRNRFVAKTPENGDLNQYWYSAATIKALVGECVGHGTRVACVSTPSVFFSLPRELRSTSAVLDLDEQWAETPGFVRYDFNAPGEIPADIQHTFDFVVVDPPFITREVWELYAHTVGLLAAPDAKILCSSVAENADLLAELLDLRPVVFKPSIPKLVYQYSLFVNYDSPALAEPNPEIPTDDD